MCGMMRHVRAVRTAVSERGSCLPAAADLTRAMRNAHGVHHQMVLCIHPLALRVGSHSIHHWKAMEYKASPSSRAKVVMQTVADLDSVNCPRETW